MKTLIIMRGLPGSGKSTRAKELELCRLSLGEALIASTDDFFVDDDGVYRYDTEKAPEAHAWNLARSKEAMDRGVPTVIIDNTNVRWEHFEPYVAHAERCGYEVTYETLISTLTNEALAQRTTHGVPADIIARMREAWDVLHVS